MKFSDSFRKYIIEGPDKRSQFKLAENGKVYYGKNPCKKEAFAIQIDGGLISSLEVKKCDKGLCVDDDRFYLIELKGSDLSTACKQLKSTLDYMEKQYSEYVYYCRGVVSRMPKVPKYYPASYLVLRKHIGNRLSCDKSPYKDTI